MYIGNDISNRKDVNSPRKCQEHCLHNENCKHWTLKQESNVCYLKSSNMNASNQNGRISGPKYCAGI